VREIQMYGADFSYPDSHSREKGRACVEFWLGLASARGCNMVIAEESMLLDAAENSKGAQFYGYDADKLTVTMDDKGFHVKREPKPLPSVEDIERRYSHDPDKEGA